MARAARRTTRKKSRRSGRGNSLATKLGWLGGGLVAGLALGYLGYMLYGASDRHQPEPMTEAPPAAPASPPASESRPEAAEPETTAKPSSQRFDFYTLLPEMEVEITEEKLNEALQAMPQNGHRGPYILQVGSFRRHQEADNLKARLALLGIEAEIQTVIIRDDDIWYRVRVGPYDSIRDLAQVRNRLNRNDIQFMLLRIGT